MPNIDYLFWAIVIATVAGAIVVEEAVRRRSTLNFGDFGNGLLGVATMIALIGGAWLYYLEGRDRPRVNITASATVVGIAPPRWRPNQPLQNVLVQITVNIENRGERGHWFNCAALDVIALEGTENRINPFPDDLHGDSLLQIDPSAPENPVWTRCVGPDGFEQRRDAREMENQEDRQGDADSVNAPTISGPPGSGARYRDFYMEPGERRTRTWEQPVPCRYNAVRVIFKLPKPEGTADYETKLIVPIADVCRGQRLVATYSGGRD